MRQTVKTLPLLLCVLLALTPLSALSESLWSETYYRAIDYSDTISDAERESLDEVCLDFTRRAEADLAVVATVSSEVGESDLSDYAAAIYRECDFGYGPDRTGFLMVWNRDTDEVAVVPFGGAESVVPQRYLDFVAGSVAKYSEEYGVYGPLYAAARMMSNYLDRDTKLSEPDVSVETPTDSVNQRVGTDGDKPAWYPTDPEHFQKYHDPDAPRIVDNAGIIDDAREPEMEARLAEIRAEVGKDIVIFTDVSSYGLTRAVYAADFYDFNGYGVGDEYEGVCIFVCMEQGNRGFWTCCTGPETKALYTEDVANQIDDITYEYMKAKQYTYGLADWMENFRRIFLTGSPYTPDWAMHYDPAAPRPTTPLAPTVVDDGDLLSADEYTALLERTKALRERYGVDVVISTARSSGAMTEQEYADAFYAANGFGVGEGYDGILLSVFRTPGYKGADVLVTPFGSVAQRMTDANRNRLVDRCDELVDDEAYGEAVSAWLDQTDHFLKTGRAPRSVASWVFSLVFSLTVGAVWGGVSLFRAHSKMQTVAPAEYAYRYLDLTKMRIVKVADNLHKTSSSRKYSPVRDRNSGGGSGGGSSSYSGSYSGSSGTSHSGSGRSF